MHVQLVQKRGYGRVKTVSCLIEWSYLITHCGMHSHASMVSGGLQVRKIVDVPRDVCHRMHHDRRWTSVGGVLVSGLAPNSTSLHSFTDFGTLQSPQGGCGGSSFVIDGQEFHNSVMQSSYSIMLHDESSSVDLSARRVQLSSGASFDYHRGHGFDTDYGHTYWDSTSDNEECSSSSYIVVYEGVATVMTAHDSFKTIIINTTTQVLAVGLRAHTLICHQPAIETDHPLLFVVTRHPTVSNYYFKKSAFDPQNIDLFLYTNSKLVYVERHIASEMTHAYMALQMRICETRAQTLTHLTSLAFVAPEEFAWAYTKRPGTTAVVRGEVVYLIECAPVSVEIRSSPLCYQELPIRYNDTDMFLKPRTRIITTFGTVVDCSPIAPPMHHINGQWVAVYPHIAVVHSPKILDANAGMKWHYTPIRNLVSAGLYSQAMLDEFQKRILFPIERQAISNNIVASVAGRAQPQQGIDGSRLFTQASFDQMQNTVMQRLYGWWWTVSVNLAGFMGFIFIGVIIKALLNTIINGTMLYKSLGCGCHLLAMFWGTLAKYFIVMMKGPRSQQTASSRDQDGDGVHLQLLAPSSPACDPDPVAAESDETLPPFVPPSVYPRATPVH